MVILHAYADQPLTISLHITNIDHANEFLTSTAYRARVDGTMHVSSTNPRFSIPGSAPCSIEVQVYSILHRSVTRVLNKTTNPRHDLNSNDRSLKNTLWRSTSRRNGKVLLDIARTRMSIITLTGYRSTSRCSL